MRELATFLDRKIDELLSAFGSWTFTRKVVKDKDHENLPTMVNYASKPNGLQVDCDAEGVVQVVFVHAAGREGYGAYPHPVAGVELSWDRARVRAHMGIPSHSTEARWIPLLKRHYGPSDRYDTSSHSIHFEFHASEPRVDLVTIMAPRQVPKG